jgi:hypothetical protein
MNGNLLKMKLLISENALLFLAIQRDAARYCLSIDTLHINARNLNSPTHAAAAAAGAAAAPGAAAAAAAAAA